MKYSRLCLVFLILLLGFSLFQFGFIPTVKANSSDTSDQPSIIGILIIIVGVIILLILLWNYREGIPQW
jgi:uncharacterized membrane protein YidH (DUF202 family)